MCGFVGVVALNQQQALDKEMLAPAVQALAQRGPDSLGYLQAQVAGCALLWAHRRLKIIDLSDSANQPFSIDALSMVFNGEIYNYVELRQELEAQGRQFATSSDTEVLLRAFECWGMACFDRLEGAFAVAILDRRSGQLVLARDRFGEKPLYYCRDQDRLTFASTLDALLPSLGAPHRDHDLDSLRSFLVLGYVAAPGTPLEGIKKVQPGTALSFALPSLAETVHQFGFRAAQFAPGNAGAKFEIDAFEQLLVTSLQKRFRADLPVVLLLSGGIDSTYLACLAKRVLKQDFRAITITDDLGESAETRRAQKVCAILGVPHTLVSINSATLNQRSGQFLSDADDLSGDPAFPVLCELFSATPRDAVVFLTGDGSDELFLSYSSYKGFLRSAHYSNAGFLARLPLLLSSWLPRFVFARLLRLVVKDPGQRLKITLESEFRRHGLADHVPAGIARLNDGIGGLYQFSIEHELPESLLYKTDRASMMFSKEARAPFLDSALFQYMLSREWDADVLGEKRQVVARINALLGSDLQFEKRGMAAGGQSNYKTSFAQLLPVARLLAAGLSRINRLKFFAQILFNPMARFRALAIRAWMLKA